MMFVTAAMSVVVQSLDHQSTDRRSIINFKFQIINNRSLLLCPRPAREFAEVLAHHRAIRRRRVVGAGEVQLVARGIGALPKIEFEFAQRLERGRREFLDAARVAIEPARALAERARDVIDRAKVRVARAARLQLASEVRRFG